MSRPVYEKTIENYLRFFREYPRYMKRGERIGQTFCNYFGIEDNVLFYCEDVNQCVSMMTEHFKRDFQEKRQKPLALESMMGYDKEC